MEGLGINGSLLIAQLINFGLIFFLLVWLLKKPLASVLKERSDKIEQSLKEAEQIKKELASIEEKKEAEMTAAKLEGEKMIARSQEIASGIEKKTKAEAAKRAEQLIERARAEIAEQKGAIKDELKDDIRGLVKDVLAHSLGELSAEEQSRLVDSSIKQLKNHEK